MSTREMRRFVRFEHGKVNALDLELLRAITATMHDVSSAGAIVLTGAGRAFSAGVDLRRIVERHKLAAR